MKENLFACAKLVIKEGTFLSLKSNILSDVLSLTLFLIFIYFLELMSLFILTSLTTNEINFVNSEFKKLLLMEISSMC